jgi:hypothetical protein
MLEDLKGRKRRNGLWIFFLRFHFQLISLRQELQSATNCSDTFKSRFCSLGQDANILEKKKTTQCLVGYFCSKIWKQPLNINQRAVKKFYSFRITGLERTVQVFSWWRNWGPKRQNHFQKVSQQTRGRAGPLDLSMPEHNQLLFHHRIYLDEENKCIWYLISFKEIAKEGLCEWKGFVF